MACEPSRSHADPNLGIEAEEGFWCALRASCVRYQIQTRLAGLTEYPSTLLRFRMWDRSSRE